MSMVFEYKVCTFRRIRGILVLVSIGQYLVRFSLRFDGPSYCSWLEQQERQAWLWVARDERDSRGGSSSIDGK